jgi:hypothetical protein
MFKIDPKRRQSFIDFLKRHNDLTEKAASTPIIKFNDSMFIGGTPNAEARQLCKLAKEEGLYSKATGNTDIWDKLSKVVAEIQQ